MSTKFRCSECSNISHSVTNETHHSCPYCGFYSKGGTLLAITEHTMHARKKTTQRSMGPVASKLRSQTRSDMEPVINAHIVASSSSANYTAIQGKRRADQW